MPEPTLANRFAAAARTSRGVTFVDLREQETKCSYAELYSRALDVAGALVALGLEPGDRAAIVLPTSPSFYAAFFGAALAGVVPVPLYPPLRLGRLEEYHARTAAMLRACGARLVLSDARVRRLLGESVERARPEFGCVAVDALPLGTADVVERAPDDIAFIQFSSGSTADPKPVALTHRQIFTNARTILATIERAHPLAEGERHVGVSWLPLYHDMGLIGVVLSALDHGGDLVLIPPECFLARPALWLRALARHRGTISAAPNFAYALCADRIEDEDLEGVDLASWRVALNGAEPVTPEVLRRFCTRFARFGLAENALTPVYGLAEATLAVTFSDLGSAWRARRFDRAALAGESVARPASEGQELVSVGRPLDGIAVRIVDAAGEPVAEGGIGRVEVHSPSNMAGYFARPDATAACLHDGWLDTGDTGFLCEGELYLHGRAKDLIVVRGRNHAPQEIEEAASAVAGVRTGCCAAIGVVPEGADGEALVVLVERAREGAGDDLAERVAREVASRAGLRPAHVAVLEPGTLPRTSSGKIRRAEARRLHLEDALAPPGRVSALRLAIAMVRSWLGFARARRAG